MEVTKKNTFLDAFSPVSVNEESNEFSQEEIPNLDDDNDGIINVGNKYTFKTYYILYMFNTKLINTRRGFR